MNGLLIPHSEFRIPNFSGLTMTKQKIKLTSMVKAAG
jgi:hypothetical protein